MEVYIGEDYEERSMYVKRANPKHLLDMNIGTAISGLLLKKIYEAGKESSAKEKLAEEIIGEFNHVLARYGLRYELISKEKLSCYRI